MCKIRLLIIDPITGEDRIVFLDDPGTSCDCDSYRDDEEER